jgi:hypothetical protein
MQPSCARHALGLGRLAAVALVCVATVLLVNSGSASVPVPRALGVSRLVVRDPSDAGSAPEAPVQYGRSDSAALLESFHSRGGRVTAFIFYGRRRYVSALWPYLLAARRSGGSGLLSRVIFVANTHDKEDLVWLDALQAAHADYVLVQQPERVVTQSQNNADYCALYREVGSGEKGKQLVIKIDDDVVYVAQDALRNLVAAKLRAQHLLFVSANVVNHPLLAHVHQRVGLLGAADVESMVSAPEEANTEDLKLLPDTWSFDYSTFSGDGWCVLCHDASSSVSLLMLAACHCAGRAARTRCYSTGCCCTGCARWARRPLCRCTTPFGFGISTLKDTAQAAGPSTASSTTRLTWRPWTSSSAAKPKTTRITCQTSTRGSWASTAAPRRMRWWRTRRTSSSASGWRSTRA